MFLQPLPDCLGHSQLLGRAVRSIFRSDSRGGQIRAPLQKNLAQQGGVLFARRRDVLFDQGDYRVVDRTSENEKEDVVQDNQFRTNS